MKLALVSVIAFVVVLFALVFLDPDHLAAYAWSLFAVWIAVLVFLWRKPLLRARADQIAERAYTVGATVGFIVLVGVVLWGWMTESEADRIAYQFKVPVKQVVVEPKPHGCDFLDAPIGLKHCHFEKTTEQYKDNSGHVSSVHVYWKKVEEQ